MKVPAVYLPEAEDDVAGTHTYYEQQRTGLGDQFVEALQDVVGQIQDNPFPYVVYYRDRGNDFLVIAVQHGRRSSRAWVGRG